MAEKQHLKRGDQRYIPPEMVRELLSRLHSLRSLARFKCVSKAWLSLTRDIIAEQKLRLRLVRVDFGQVRLIRGKEYNLRKRRLMIGEDLIDKQEGTNWSSSRSSSPNF